MDIPQRVRLVENGKVGTLLDVLDDHVVIQLDGGPRLKLRCPYFPKLPYEPLSVSRPPRREARRRPPRSASPS